MVSVTRHIKSFILPFGMAILIPAIILVATKTPISGIAQKSPALQTLVALCFFALGACLFSATIKMFGNIGKGTLAPWDPTQKLVVTGIYKRTRNPMITGVLCVICGEAALLASPALLIWAACFFVLNTVYFKLSEEPGLRARFGPEYDEYRKNVPMWLPRLKPWAPDNKS